MTDTPITIAWLGLLDSDDATGSPRAQDHLVRLAQQVVAASGYGWSIELISCGRDPGRRSISAGVEKVVLSIAGSPRTVWDRTAWALADAIADADLVHLHDGFSRSCDLALLIAKQARKPVCVTEWGVEGHWLSGELSLRELADVVICHDRAVAEELKTSKPVELAACAVDLHQLGVPAPWPATGCLDVGNRAAAPPPPHIAPACEPSPVEEQYAAAGARLYAVYHRLIAGTRRVAA